MAEEKKPKIDLKARLGKTAMGQTPPPAGAGAAPPPQAAPPPGASSGGVLGGAPAPSPSQRPPAAMPQPVPAPMPAPGMPIGPPTFKGPSRPPPGLDASNPLAAIAAPPYRAPAPAPVQPQATRIEVDEAAVQQAAKGGMKKGVVAGLVAAVVFAVVGYLAGGAAESSSGRKKSVQDAQELSKDVAASKDKLKDLADKLEAGRNSLLKDKKFPDTLAKDLGGLNVDFGGDKLQYRRFSGFSAEATNGLVEYITSVQGVNDRKSAVIGLLSKLQKPITEQFKAAGQLNVAHVILLGRQDESKNYFALIGALNSPIPITQQSSPMPAEFAFTDVVSKQGTKLPKYTSGDLTKPSAIYLQPKALEAVCPPDVVSQSAQLGLQIKLMIDAIRGEGGTAAADPTMGDMVQDKKPSLMDRADKLVIALNKVGN